MTVKVQGGLGAQPPEKKLKVHRGQGFVEKRDGKFLSVTEGGRGGFGNFQRDLIIEQSLRKKSSKNFMNLTSLNYSANTRCSKK